MAAPTVKSDDVFGNSALFEEFSTTVESCKHRKKRTADLEESEKNDLEAKIQKLEEENLKLQSWLKVCIKAKGYKVAEGTHDGPLAQVVYMNNDNVCKYRHQIEFFFERLLETSQWDQANAGNRRPDFTRPLPQRASMVLTDNPDPATREAFTATGNVQYFLSFCLDTLGRPLVDGTAELTEGWEIPPYPIVFREALPIDDKPSAPSKGKRFKASCFNCGNEKHSLRDCPQPRDLVRISQNKKLFMDQVGSSPSGTISGRRYHKDGEQGGGKSMEEKFAKYKPGEVSDGLRQAMGISSRQLPPFIYNMRRLGYPPGHLLDAQVHTSDLKVYNIKDTDEEGELTADSGGDGQTFYNLKKLIDYPGFNVDADQNTQDEWRKYNSLPMQNHHRKEVVKMQLKPMEADEEMLTPSNKRRNQSFLESGSSTKRQRRSGTEPVPIDMDISCDEGSLTGTPGRGWFQPPLPPTPEMATPPPLPPGPSPITPYRDSPLASRSPSVHTSQSSSRSGSPDLDRLMSERTKLLAALDNKGEESAATSQSDLMASTEESMTAEEDGEERDGKIEIEKDDVKQQASIENGSGPTKMVSNSSEEVPRSNGEKDNENKEEGKAVSESDPEPASKDSPDSPDPSLDTSQLIVLDSTEGDSSVFMTSQEEDEEEELPNRSGVPHRRKFSVNITPHDFDPEEPAKKGIFKKLLNILKREKR